jgi:hypothetical protein
MLAGLEGPMTVVTIMAGQKPVRGYSKKAHKIPEPFFGMPHTCHM